MMLQVSIWDFAVNVLCMTACDSLRGQ